MRLRKLPRTSPKDERARTRGRHEWWLKVKHRIGPRRAPVASGRWSDAEAPHARPVARTRPSAKPAWRLPLAKDDEPQVGVGSGSPCSGCAERSSPPKDVRRHRARTSSCIFTRAVTRRGAT